MQLLFVNDRRAIDKEIKTRIGPGAAEARRILKQTSNDERRALHLQIAREKIIGPFGIASRLPPRNLGNVWTFRTSGRHLRMARKSRQR
jgi:hypothetical protein